LGEEQLSRHIGYDIGALPVATLLAKRLGATIVYTRYSRLLIDPNRGADDPTLIMQLSDGAVIPGNARLDKAEVQKRIACYFDPYHNAVTREIDDMLARGVTPTLFSLHSYTDIWRGVLRKWHCALLWDKDPRLAVPLMHELEERTGFEIGDNEPYSGRLRGNSIYTHGTLRGLPNVLFEIRQDLIREADGQRAWAGLLAECLESIFAQPAHKQRLCRVDYYGSHTDVHGGERYSL
jgi:predicted N-formylglutamate amidohydrolase